MALAEKTGSKIGTDMQLKIICGLFLAGSTLVAMSARAEDLAANPTYTAWAKYKPGTTVTFAAVLEDSSRKNGKDEFKSTQTLAAVSKDSVGVSLRGRTGRSIEFPIPAKIKRADAEFGIGELPDGAKVSNFKSGTEKIEANGKTYDAVTREMDIEDPNSSLKHVKYWLVDDVPGGVVKSRREYVDKVGDQKNTTSDTETLAAVKVAK
jgi:hypothetical protein